MPVNYVAQGRIVISTFLGKFQSYNGYALTEAELFAKILKYDSAQFLQTLGSAYMQGLEGRFDRLSDAMDELASATKGGFPDSSGFFQAMQGQIGGFNLIKDITSGVGSDLYDGAIAFGETSLSILKGLNFLLPIIVFGGIGFFLYKNKDLLDLKKVKS